MSKLNKSDNSTFLFYDYLENFIVSNIKEEMLLYEMKNFIMEMKNKFRLTLICEIIEDIDNFIIRPCYYEDISYINLENILNIYEAFKYFK